MQVQVVGFDSFKDLYSTDPYIRQIYEEVSIGKGRLKDFCLHSLTLKHKPGAQNKVADALSKRSLL
jgi:hypothetical protein